MMWLWSMMLLSSIVAGLTIPSSQSRSSSHLQAPLTTDFHIPSVHDSAVMARRILHLEDIGTLSTTFPSIPSTNERRPKDVGGLPFGTMEYFSDCEPTSGNPTLLQVDIGTSFRNARAGSNMTLSVQWHPPHLKTYSAVSMPRFSLIGYLETMTGDDVEDNDVEQCYLRAHPEAITWFPGNGIHTSRWARLVVEEVYWIGGFGDRAYIGWIPLDVWQNVTTSDIKDCLLPGEKR